MLLCLIYAFYAQTIYYLSHLWLMRAHFYHLWRELTIEYFMYIYKVMATECPAFPLFAWLIRIHTAVVKENYSIHPVLKELNSIQQLTYGILFQS